MAKQSKNLAKVQSMLDGTYGGKTIVGDASVGREQTRAIGDTWTDSLKPPLFRPGLKIKEGMVISNEPGYYERGKFGIRIENLILVRKIKNFYKFDNLTLAPIDKSLIVKKLLNKNEISWLNNYHMKVFNNLKNFMSKAELIELKNSCSNI